jgi:hypothetical protein
MDAPPKRDSLQSLSLVETCLSRLKVPAALDMKLYLNGLKNALGKQFSVKNLTLASATLRKATFPGANGCPYRLSTGVEFKINKPYTAI